MLDGVREVVRITQPYKLASRAFRPQGTVVELPRGVRIGGTEVVVAAGPCSVETPEQIGVIADRVAKAGAKILRGGAFKPRSSPYSFQGHGEKALNMMRDAADKSGLLVCSEVMDASQIQMMLPYVDIFQVGARNMQNYFLLRALGTVSKPVLLKRGMSATIEELLLSAEYIMAGGNHNVILCERGIRTFETATRNTLDIAAIPVIKKLSHLPDSSPIRRTAPEFATRFLRWRAPRSPPAPTACSSKCTTIPSTRFPTARNRSSSINLKNSWPNCASSLPPSAGPSPKPWPPPSAASRFLAPD